MRKITVFFVLTCLLAALFAVGCGSSGSSTNPVGATSADGARASLTGVVTFEGHPISNAAVYLRRSDKAHMAGISKMSSLRASVMAQQAVNADGNYQTMTDAHGRFNFVDVPVGEYTLIAVQDGNHQYAEPGIRLGMIAEVNPVLTPTGRITGHVAMEDVEQTPVSGATVYLQGTSYVAVTDIDGNFTLSNVPASREYSLTVSSAKGTMPSPRTVMASPGVETEVTPQIALLPQQFEVSIVTGSITSSELETLDGVMLIMISESNDIWATTTDAEGKYAFVAHERGTYRLGIGIGDYYGRPSSRSVVVAESDTYTVPSFEVFSNKTELVTGSVNKLQLAPGDAGGEGVAVTLISEGTNTRVTEVSGESGRFKFEVAPGTYTLSVGGYYKLPDATPVISIVAPHAFTEPIDVEPNEYLPGSAKITISLAATSPSTAPDNIPTFPLECLVEYVGPEPDRSYAQQRTTDTGILLFNDLPAGDYRARVNPKLRGFSGQSEVFTVNVDETSSVSFEVSFAAPHISSVEPILVDNTGLLSLNAVNLTANVKGAVNGVPVTTQTDIAAGLVEFDLSTLSPGQHTIQLFDDLLELNSRSRQFTKNLIEPYAIIDPVFKDWNRVTGEWEEVIFEWKSDPHASFDEIWVTTGVAPAEVEVYRATISGGEMKKHSIKGIKADIAYNLYIKSQYGTAVAQAGPEGFSEPAPLINQVTLQYDGSAGYELFGFEVTGTHYYIGQQTRVVPNIFKYLRSDGSVVATATFSTSDATPSAKSMVSDQAGNIYVYYTADSFAPQSRIIKFNANLVQQGDEVIAHSSSPIENGELKFIGGDLYLVGTVPRSDLPYVGYRFPGGELASPTNFYQSAAFAGSASQSGLDAAIIADADSMFLVQSIGSEFELYRFPLSEVTSATGALTNATYLLSRCTTGGVDSAGIADLALDSSYLYFRGSNSADTGQKISKSSGYQVPMTVPNHQRNYSSFVADHRDRLWMAEKEASGGNYIMMNNGGNVSAHFPVFRFAEDVEPNQRIGRSFIKSDGSTVHLLELMEDSVQAPSIGGVGVYMY